jgi:hypothetical protein
MNQELGAQAFTHGSDVYFGAGKEPGNNELTAHELTHVVQQTGVGNNSIVQNKVHSCSCPECVGTLGQLKRQSTRSLNTVNRTLTQTSIQGLTRTTPGIQCKPAEVTSYNFMGLSVAGGINAEMQSRLTDVTNHLRSRYTTIHGAPPTNDKKLREWCGVNDIRGWRHRPGSKSKHSSGSAVDVNYKNQPYIVTRTLTNGKTVLGGEKAGNGLTNERQATVDVFDRAVNFVHSHLPFAFFASTPMIQLIGYQQYQQADVSSRKPNETTTSVYKRFRGVSDDLSTYLGLVFHTEPIEVRRQPIANIEKATKADLLKAISTKERKVEKVAIENIRQYILNKHKYLLPTLSFMYNLMYNIDFSTWEEYFLVNPYVDQQLNRYTERWFYRILRDYEHVRIPMVKGNPEPRPGLTRNPARGFLDMSEEFVVAMTDVGKLRWGIADLGNAESGDTHHFDLGGHGGVTPDGSS